MSGYYISSSSTCFSCLLSLKFLLCCLGLSSGQSNNDINSKPSIKSSVPFIPNAGYSSQEDSMRVGYVAIVISDA